MVTSPQFICEVTRAWGTGNVTSYSLIVVARVSWRKGDLTTVNIDFSPPGIHGLTCKEMHESFYVTDFNTHVMWLRYHTGLHTSAWSLMVTIAKTIWYKEPSHDMMTSGNGIIFLVTGPLCGEFTGYRWIPLTKASDAEHWCFFNLRLNERLSKQSRRWWFGTPSRSLERHCNEPCWFHEMRHQIYHTMQYAISSLPSTQ